MINISLKQLRNEHHLTQANLAKILGIAPTTLAAYEQGKSEPNIETLTKLANYFNVSIDYLLGLTDVKTTNLDVAYMSDYLGLKERSIETLHQYIQLSKKDSKRISQTLDTLNILLAPDVEILDHISDYLNFSATHFKNFYDEDVSSLAPISELELWDDIEKLGYSDDWDMWSKALLLVIEEELMQLRNTLQFEKRNDISNT